MAARKSGAEGDLPEGQAPIDEIQISPAAPAPAPPAPAPPPAPPAPPAAPAAPPARPAAPAPAQQRQPAVASSSRSRALQKRSSRRRPPEPEEEADEDPEEEKRTTRRARRSRRDRAEEPEEPKSKRSRRSRRRKDEEEAPAEAEAEDVEEAAEEEEEKTKSTRRSRRSRRDKRSSRRSDDDDDDSDRSKRSKKRRRRLPKITLSMLKWPAIVLGVAAAVVVAAAIKPYMRKKSFAALHSADERTRLGAIQAVSAEGGASVGQLIKIISADNEVARDAAAVALARIAFAGNSEAVVTGIKDLLDTSPDVAVRAAAARALALSRQPDAVVVLTGMLSDKEAAVRTAGAANLMYAKSGEAMAFHLKAMADGHHEVQEAAAKNMGTCLSEASVGPLVKKLKSTANKSVQRACAKALLKLEEFVESESILFAADNEEGPVRIPIITILCNKSDKDAMPTLAKHVTDQVADIRRMCIQACTIKGYAEIGPKLPSILKDDGNAEVRRAAAYAIGKLKVGAGAAALMHRLADKHEPLRVRIACATAFGGLGPEDLSEDIKWEVYRTLIDTLRQGPVMPDLAAPANGSLAKVTGVGSVLRPKQWVDWYKGERKKIPLIAEFKAKAQAVVALQKKTALEWKDASRAAEKLRDEIKKVKDGFKDPGELDVIFWELNDLAKKYDMKAKELGIKTLDDEEKARKELQEEQEEE